MSAASTPCTWWGCDICGTAVFMADVWEGQEITGGVCTQKARSGCRGKLEKLDDVTVTLLRERMARSGVVEQPWLTLVLRKAPS